jgi:hypothetical protein
LDGCIYEEEQIDGLMELDDASVPLQQRHIAPWFAKGRKGARGEDGEEEEAITDPSLQWSLRKACAAALDSVRPFFWLFLC